MITKIYGNNLNKSMDYQLKIKQKQQNFKGATIFECLSKNEKDVFQFFFKCNYFCNQWEFLAEGIKRFEFKKLNTFVMSYPKGLNEFIEGDIKNFNTTGMKVTSIKEEVKG